MYVVRISIWGVYFDSAPMLQGAAEELVDQLKATDKEMNVYPVEVRQ
jgi:hypothetical protein